MKIKIKVQDQYYEVEILDLNSRPVIAIVDGTEFEVWPQQDENIHPMAQLSGDKSPAASQSAPVGAPASHAPEPSLAALSSNILRAPIPGVVAAIKVHPGETVTIGQELLVIEAMKMRNAIRSPRHGQIALVHVSTGQTVNHNDPLIEFSEPGQSGD